MLEVYLGLQFIFQSYGFENGRKYEEHDVFTFLWVLLLFFKSDAVRAKRSLTLLNARCSTHKKQQSPPTREHRSPANHHQTSYDISHQEFMTKEETTETAYIARRSREIVVFLFISRMASDFQPNLC